MVDKVSNETRSKIMKAVKMKDSNIEKEFRKKLWASGIRFRKNNNKLFGNPDVSISKYKLVIFIDSCFWHGCEKHFRMPASNKKYWRDKLKRNKKRDKVVVKYYKNNKWDIVRVWEHSLSNKNDMAIDKIIKLIRESRNG